MIDLKHRLFNYLLGLFIMAVGIGFSIKSNMGVSPISTLPYTLTVVWGVEIGLATIIFHCGLVLLQILLLRRSFELKNLLQVVVGIIFGYFTSLSVYIVSLIPDFNNILVSFVYLGISIVAIAFGIFLYLPANIVPLAGEGAMQAISIAFDKVFHKVKIAFDSSMVIVSLLTCIIMIHSLGSVGLGTILAAYLVGTTLKYIVKIFEHFKGYNPMIPKRQSEEK